MTAGFSGLSADTLAFLFTDIEGSTGLWERRPEAMSEALARHDGLLREIIETHGGHVFKTMGDAVCAAFRTRGPWPLCEMRWANRLCLPYGRRGAR